MLNRRLTKPLTIAQSPNRGIFSILKPSEITEEELLAAGYVSAPTVPQVMVIDLSDFDITQRSVANKIQLPGEEDGTERTDKRLLNLYIHTEIYTSMRIFGAWRTSFSVILQFEGDEPPPMKEWVGTVMDNAVKLHNLCKSLTNRDDVLGMLCTILSTYDSFVLADLLLQNADPIEPFRGADPQWLLGFARWLMMVYCSDGKDRPANIPEMVAAIQTYQEAISAVYEVGSNFICVEGLAGNGGITHIAKTVNASFFNILTEEGILLVNVRFGRDSNFVDGVTVIDTEFGHAVEMLDYLKKDARTALKLRFQQSPTLQQFTSLPVAERKEILEVLSNGLISSIETIKHWEVLFSGREALKRVAVRSITGYQVGRTDWIESLIQKARFDGNTQQLYNAFNYSMRMTITDEELRQTEIPDNPLVQSVEMIRSGRMRIVLREIIYPTIITKNNRSFVEIEGGTVLSDMGVAAFDLTFPREGVSGFPSASAYLDFECTIPAKHTNITTGGHVCLGNINDHSRRNTEDLQIPSVGDFVQMLRQCNLDSAYNRSKDFVLADPSIISDTDWNAGLHMVPGLVEIDIRISARS